MANALDELGQSRFVTKDCLAVFRRRLRECRRHVARNWLDLEPIPWALCHGDLRADNLVWDAVRGVTLVDFEHAGLADPIVDLCRFAAFVPLSRYQELCLVDAYAEATGKRHLGRYFTYRPLGPLFAAVMAARHLAQAARGYPGTLDVEWLATRFPTVENRLARVMGRKVRLARGGRRQRAFRGVVVVDGTAGSGKTPIAAALARELEVPHFNTGAAFRAAALLALEHGFSPDRPADVSRLVRRLTRTALRLTEDGRIRVDGRVLAASLDVWAVEATVARWARVAEVREALRPVLGIVRRAKSAVVEGRAVGRELVSRPRVVFFVEGSTAVRAVIGKDRAGGDPRRYLRVLAARDRLDRERTVAPAVPAVGAIRVRSGPDLGVMVSRMLRRLL